MTAVPALSRPRWRARSTQFHRRPGHGEKRTDASTDASEIARVEAELTYNWYQDKPEILQELDRLLV